MHWGRSAAAIAFLGVFFMSVAYDPNRQGWGAALATCVLTAALGFTAYTIHKNTYRHPRDPMTQQVYHAEDLAKASEHGGAHGAEKAEGAKGEASTSEASKGDAKPADAKH